MRISSLIHVAQAIGKGEERISPQIKKLWHSLLPDVPRESSFRNGAADGLFVILLLVTRSLIVAGAVIGAEGYGFVGLVSGLVAGWITRQWLRHSLGLHERNLTHSFYHRMFERGNGGRPCRLESLIEGLRGRKLSTFQCRQVANAYAVAVRQLQCCDSPMERSEIQHGLRRDVWKAMQMGYSAQPSSAPEKRP